VADGEDEVVAADTVQYVVAARELAQNSHHCPHGRPTSLLFTLAELGKQYRRT
jgi:DNA mismatch repair protein MutL